MTPAQLALSERDVLRTLRQRSGPVSPIDLINALRSDYSEDDIRRAMWRLIARHQVVLTRERMLAPDPTSRSA